MNNKERESIKQRTKKNRIINTTLSLVLAGTIGASSLGYFHLSTQIEDSNAKTVQANKKIEKLEEERDTLKTDLELVSEWGKELEEKANNLQVEKENLETEKAELTDKNTELKNYIDKVNNIPKWNPDNVTTDSGVSEVGLSLALEGTGLEGLAHSFIQAEEEYGINAIFLVSLIAQESAWGNSNRAKRDNNLSGYAVYTDSSAGRKFSSKGESIMETASLLAEHYVGEGRMDIHSINSKYSADDKWATNISHIANDITVTANVNNHIEGLNDY
jgi:beta-N-acetylglucosaminidase